MISIIFIALIMGCGEIEQQQQSVGVVDSTTYVNYLSDDHFRTYGWKGGRIVVWGFAVTDSGGFKDDYSLYLMHKETIGR